MTSNINGSSLNGTLQRNQVANNICDCQSRTGSIASAMVSVQNHSVKVGKRKVMEMGHKDDDPDKTKEEYDNDNHSDQLNPNNDEYAGDDE